MSCQHLPNRYPSHGEIANSRYSKIALQSPTILFRQISPSYGRSSNPLYSAPSLSLRVSPRYCSIHILSLHTMGKFQDLLVRSCVSFETSTLSFIGRIQLLSELITSSTMLV